MAIIFGREIQQGRQYLISLCLVLSVSLLCFALSAFIEYRVVALILLLTVSLAAISFDILPVLFTATLSALIWDFFFIPPRFALHIHTTDDSILLLMYFIIALINAVLTYKIRQIEKISRHKEDRANAILLYNTFLNSLSHELRTPIAAIIGATDNLQDDNNNLSAAHKTELISEISKAGLRLNQQVENLLAMSRLDSGFIQSKMDWCDLPELMHRIVRSIQESRSDQSIIVHTEPDIPLFRIDTVMVEQILYNLINNASHHNVAGTTISVIAEGRKGLLRLCVEDDGSGIPADEINFVFEKFYRLKDSKTSGTGLGLSIVKGFTEALGGTVQLQNISTGGCRFIIDLPAESSYLKP